MQKQTGFRLGFALGAMAALAVSGCGHARVRPMEIASDAGAQAVAKYDTNKDGALDYTELAKAPGLQAAVAKIKKFVKRRGEIPSENQLASAKITAEEIDARIKEWKDRGTGRVRVTCHVTRTSGGSTEPLRDAEIKYVPEDFLGPGLTTGTGKTDSNGNATISQPSRGAGDPDHGMSPGFYRIEITKPGDDIPSKYNTETVLGQEVAADALGITGAFPIDLEY
jgi:hypothetical protein